MNEPSNPMETAQRLMRRELPKRFYKDVTVMPQDGSFAVLLDGKTARTPGRKLLAAPNAAVAERLAGEWASQLETIDPAKMPLTRLINSALDRVSGDLERVRADIVQYAGSDLICYRAEGPGKLVAAQDAHWNPLVDWARDALGARLALALGLVHVAQEDAVSAAVAQAIAPLDPLSLAALHVVTTLAGSPIIALAVAKRRLTPDEAWTAAHVDEDWQRSQWGDDTMAAAARADRRRDFDAATFVLLSG